MTDRLKRARELCEAADEQVTIVGLGHAKVALSAGCNGRDKQTAARQADRRIAALFDRECGVPTDEAARQLREARQVLACVIDQPAEVPA